MSDIDRRFDNFGGSHLQSQAICVTPVDGINTQLVDVIFQQSHRCPMSTRSVFVQLHENMGDFFG